MKKIFHYMMLALCVGGLSITASSCSLDEENPGGFTMENSAKTKEGFEYLVNNCYFAYERYFSGTENWAALTEGNTDLWTYQANNDKTWTQWFWFYAGAVNSSYTANWWNGTYDGIGSCNLVLSLADVAPHEGDELNELLAQARFMRAIYYFNAVSQFGGVTMITTPPAGIEFEPKRTDPMTIYEEMIIPDLLFAFDHLNVGTDDLNTIPTKKAALGYLAKAYLQTCEFDDTKKYAGEALRYAKMLIEDAEAGGAKYNAYMYPTYDEVFAEENNWDNKEALWKHRWFAGSSGHGSSNGNWKLNRNHEYFYCKYTNFAARADKTLESRRAWGGNPPGLFMPTQHLLNLFVNEDNTLDPRFHKIFQTEWVTNEAYTWNADDVARYDRTTSVVGTKLDLDDLAIKFIMPQDPDYATESTNKFTRDYLVIDYNDVYNDNGKNVKLMYTYQNPSGEYTGSKDNLFRYFYPSLTKFNSSRYYTPNESRHDRNGNLNSILIMRMAEVYLIAAEADIYANGGGNAMGYINTVRTRAGADPLTGTATIQTVLDERGRELCGESLRFYDLKRTGMYKNENYLALTHPDLAKYFKPEYALRPIPTAFLDVIKDGGAYYQNPGY